MAETKTFENREELIAAIAERLSGEWEGKPLTARILAETAATNAELAKLFEGFASLGGPAGVVAKLPGLGFFGRKRKKGDDDGDEPTDGAS